MRKFVLATLFAAIVSSGAFAVGQESQGTNNIPNRGRAPVGHDGVGVVDARVFDENGNPVPGAEVRLESRRINGMFCESWHRTNAQGVAVMAPLHIGRLTMIVRAPGFRTQRIQVPASSIGEPVRVTLVRR